jgi:hypothetical protein
MKGHRPAEPICSGFCAVVVDATVPFNCGIACAFPAGEFVEFPCWDDSPYDDGIAVMSTPVVANGDDSSSAAGNPAPPTVVLLLLHKLSLNVLK